MPLSVIVRGPRGYSGLNLRGSCPALFALSLFLLGISSSNSKRILNVKFSSQSLRLCILVQEIGINRVSPADLKIARGQSWLGSALEHLRGRCCLVRVFQCSIQFELWGRPIVQFITSARVAWQCQASCSSTFESVAPLWVLTTRLLVSPAFAGNDIGKT